MTAAKIITLRMTPHPFQRFRAKRTVRVRKTRQTKDLKSLISPRLLPDGDEMPVAEAAISAKRMSEALTRGPRR